MTGESGERPLFAIAGGGIAGLSAGIALSLSGFTARIFEREHAFQPIGAGIQLSPNVTRLLAEWGVALPLAACEPEALELRNAQTGKLLNTVPLGAAVRDRYSAPYITLLRSELQTALFDRARALGVPIAFASPVTGAGRRAGGLTLSFESGEIAAAALIGADGVHSTVRQFVPSASQPFDSHTVIWRALLAPGAVPAPFRNRVTVWMSSGAHLVHYPISGGSALNAVLAIDRDWRTPGAGDGADHRAFLTHRLSAWSPIVADTVASADNWEPWSVLTVAPWKGGRRRIQLVGDAWHAMPPYLASGGAMAIEDAAVLATSLSNAKGHVILGLDAFRERRSRRIRHVHHRSAQMGRIYHFPQPFDAIRDRAIQAASGRMLLAANDWLYRGAI